METNIRVGQRPFFGDPLFSRGLSRCGYFTVKEAKLLEEYGDTLQGLSSGTLVATNDDEARFLKEIHGVGSATSPLVALWQKYVAAIRNSRTSIGFRSSALSASDFQSSLAEDYEPYSNVV